MYPSSKRPSPDPVLHCPMERLLLDKRESSRPNLRRQTELPWRQPSLLIAMGDCQQLEMFSGVAGRDAWSAVQRAIATWNTVGLPIRLELVAGDSTDGLPGLPGPSGPSGGPVGVMGGPVGVMGGPVGLNGGPADRNGRLADGLASDFAGELGAVSGGQRPDVIVGWYTAHSDPESMFVGSIHAHADYPPGNTLFGGPPLPLHFNASVLWGIEAAGCYDIETIALHELAHLLGLIYHSGPNTILYDAIPPAPLGIHHDLDFETQQRARLLYAGAPAI